MYPVSQDFQEQMIADKRQVFARVMIDYTSPFLDESISVAASELANVSFPMQTADSVAEPLGKIASLDGSWVLDGSYALAPATAEEAELHQMGWWGKQLAGEGGAFVAPYPTLTVTFFPRPITRLQVIGDSKRGEYPVDFAIRLYGETDLLLHTETVTGNAGVTWSKTLEAAVTQVTKMVLEITRWSHAGRQAKILEFFTSIQETYEGDDILLIHLLEEREVSQGSLPVGNISANEIDIKLNNEHRKFDAGNEQSPLYGSLKANRRIRAWLGMETAEGKEYVPLGTFWSGDWNVPEDGVHAQTTGRDRLELLRKSTYSVSKVLPEAKELPSPTFTRASEAYLSDGTKVAVGHPRFEAGKFGKALLVEEGTTNRLSAENASFEGGTIGSWTSIAAALSVVNTGWHGVKGLKVAPTTVSGRAQMRIDSLGLVTVGNTVTFSAYAKLESGDPALVSVGITVDGIISYCTHATVSSDKWTRISVTCTLDSFGSGVYIQLFGGRYGGPQATVIFDGVQLELKPYATSFTDSTRAAERLDISTDVVPKREGTISIWMQFAPNTFSTYGWRHLWDTTGDRFACAWRDYGSRIEVRRNGITVLIVSTPDGFDETQWHFYTVRWSPTETALFVDGMLWGKATGDFPDLAPGSIFALGNRYQNTGYENGSLIDDLRISSCARTDEEILQAYASGKPAVWDEDTTYILRFDGDMQTAQQTATLHGLAKNILTDAELTTEEYWLDPELKLFPVPYAWFEPQSHREALRKIAEACLGQVYCDRDGILRIEGPSYLAGHTESVLTLTGDDYFRKDNPVKWSDIANYVEVETQPLRPDVLQEVYRSNEPVSIAAGQMRTITAFYNEPPCIEAVASLEDAPAGCTIESATYYAWGADVKVTSTTTGTFTLVIEARPLKVLNKEKAIAKDDESILDNGLLKYTFPANPLIQTLEVAQTIAEKLLASAKLARRDLEMEWRGNPALLLGDRVTVTDKNEQNDYFVTRQELEFDGALRARLSGRRV